MRLGFTPMTSILVHFLLHVGTFLAQIWEFLAYFGTPRATSGPTLDPFERQGGKTSKMEPNNDESGVPFGVTLSTFCTLGPFWGPRRSTNRGFLGDLLLDRILHRFWTPLGGVRHAIRSCQCMFAKGRPFLKMDHFEVQHDLPKLPCWEAFGTQIT